MDVMELISRLSNTSDKMKRTPESEEPLEDGVSFDEDARLSRQAKRVKIDVNDNDEDYDEDDDDPSQQSKFDIEESYSERQEPYPACAMFDPDVAEIKLSLEGISKHALTVLEEHPCNNFLVEQFKRKAQELVTMRKPRAVRIALLGNAGAGKSSLLNSLTDITGLAKTGAVGNSCTYVATEYGSAFPDQKEMFAARVVYFEHEAIRELLQEHVNAYFEFFWEKDENWTEDEKEEHHLKAKTALKTFIVLFCDVDSFKSEKAARQYLDSKKLDKGHIVAQMFDSAKKLLDAGGRGGRLDAYYREAADEREYHKIISPLLTPREDKKEPALWPLVKFVTIGVKGSRVLDHVTMVDLPGISDTNQVRVNATHDRLRACTGLWIVTSVGRAIDDITVASLFSRYEERFQGKIVVICTRSDVDVNAELRQSLEEKGVSIEVYTELDDGCKRLQREIALIKAKLSGRKRSQNTKRHEVRVRDLRAKLAEAEERLTDAKNSRFASLVQARNEHVTKGLKAELGSRLEHSVDIPVFCVSNEHYKTLKDRDESGSHQLGPKDTGIPSLRAYALGLADLGYMQNLDDYVNHEFTVFFNSLRMWSMNQHLAGKEAVLRVVERPTAQVDSTIEAYRIGLNAFVQENLQDHFVHAIPKYSQAAQDVFAKKRRWRHWQTIRAFMRKGGNHRTKICPQECWNEEFLEPHIKALDIPWRMMKTHQEGLMAVVKTEMESNVSRIRRDIRAVPGSEVLDMTNFDLMLQGHANGIANFICKHQENYVLEMSNILLDATQDRHTGFFTKAMKPAYDQCRADSGPGTLARSCYYLTSHLAKKDDDSPFFEAIVGTCTAIVSNAKIFADALQVELARICIDIYNYLDGMIKEQAFDTEDHPVHVAMRKFVDEAGPGFQEALQELERVKTKYKVAETAHQ